MAQCILTRRGGSETKINLQLLSTKTHTGAGEEKYTFNKDYSIVMIHGIAVNCTNNYLSGVDCNVSGLIGEKILEDKINDIRVDDGGAHGYGEGGLWLFKNVKSGTSISMSGSWQMEWHIYGQE